MDNGSETSDAKKIAEAVLQGTGESLFKGDFAEYVNYFSLPQTIETFKGVRRISTEEDLRAVFDALRASLEKMGVTDYERRCIASEFIAPDLISTSHETRLMRGNELLHDPYPVHGRIKRIDGQWKIVDGSYAIRGVAGIENALHAEKPEE